MTVTELALLLHAAATAALHTPELAATFVAALEHGGGESRSLREAAASRDLLLAEGWTSCPEWRALASGSAAPQQLQAPLTGDAENAIPEEGEFSHGWQFHAADARERFALELAWSQVRP